MKKSLRKILFAILTVFAVFFVVACGNKEDAKINKEEIFQKSVEANSNIKSGTTYIKDGMVYATTGNNDWQKEALSENDAENFKDSLDSSIEMNKILKDHLDKVTIKEEEGNYIVSIDKDSDFLKEFLNKEVSNIVGQNIDFDLKNAIVEYVILSNINSVEEITVPEEALNSNN